MAKICQESNGGYVDYTWPKPVKDGTVTADKPKLSYVKIFKPWNWVVGTGVYVDNIEDSIRQTEEALQNQVNLIVLKILLCAAVILVAAILFCFITANTLAAPVAQLVATMRKTDLDNLSSTEIKLDGPHEIRELSLIFNTMLSSIHDSVIHLKETTSAKERIESELNIARSIQMSIIPNLFPAFPHRPEFDVYACIVTAKAVGGDLYDFFFMDDDHLCFAIGDVSGKGVPASLFMAVTRTLMRAKTVKGQTAGEIATLMNQILCQDNNMSMFVTFFLCVLEISTGKLDCCNAGHNPPFILRRMQTIDRLGKVHGPPLGVFNGNPYASETVTLEPGDTILLYTDGVTEASNVAQELFDETRLLAALEECKMQSPKGITDIILAKATAFAGGAEQADDITILALNYRGNIKKA
jgi:sigma-B regulation protein RsbU (phosphoserine phosphatase)